MRLRVLQHPPGPAAWNMGLDEALLRCAREPTLRLYEWRPAAVSLGWFQRFADFADLPPHVPIVRRLTGGGAIWHDDELTFALAVDAEVLGRDVAAGYRLLHDAAILALAAIGVVCQRFEDGKPSGARPRDRWCFREPGRDDVVTAHGKILGSAQRRLGGRRPRVLHHGSLVLARPLGTPFAAAVADAVAPTPDLRQRLRGVFVARVAQALGLSPEDSACTAEERAAATSYAARYADPAFVRCR